LRRSARTVGDVHLEIEHQTVAVLDKRVGREREFCFLALAGELGIGIGRRIVRFSPWKFTVGSGSSDGVLSSSFFLKLLSDAHDSISAAKYEADFPRAPSDAKALLGYWSGYLQHPARLPYAGLRIS
jgi:hypothetical protein